MIIKKILRQLATKRVVDLRSDTVTLPLPGMVNSISRAQLGDNTYDEDFTTINFQKKVAKLFNKEAALLVPTATMSNLISTRCLAKPGQTIILGKQCHIFNYEEGGVSSINNIMVNTVDMQPDGSISLKVIEKNLKPDLLHYSPTAAFTLENTNNMQGGTVLPLQYLERVWEFKKKHGLKVHMDGARIFNAHLYFLMKGQSDLPISDLVKEVDTLTICFSKGLSCPFGAMIIGSEEIIRQARRYQSVFGGCLRQTGVVASMAEWAFDRRNDILEVDHKHAQVLALMLKEIGYPVSQPQTNILLIDFNMEEQQKFVQILNSIESDIQVKVSQRFDGVVRLVLNSLIQTDDIYQSAKIFKEAWKKFKE